MASVFRPTYTKRTDDGKTVKRTSRCYWIEYRDPDGVLKRVRGFVDRRATQKKAAEIEKALSRGEAPVDPQAAQDARSMAEHLVDYDKYLTSQDAGARWRRESIARINKVVDELEAVRLVDLDGARVAAFLATKVEQGSSARTRNAYRTSVGAFMNWCRADGRLPKEHDALALVGTLNEQRDPKRKRRALTTDELHRLVDATRRRPLDAATKERCNAGVSTKEREKLIRRGDERAIIYMTLYYTGVRIGELSGIRVGDLVLPTEEGKAGLATFFSKAQKPQTVPLRPDLVAELKAWIKANDLTLTDKLFSIPGQLVKILRKDLKHAGIAYRDAMGRTADVHSLRHTMATALSVAGVLPRTAQKLLRHSRIDLTMNTYTDAGQLDSAAGVAALPALPSILATPAPTPPIASPQAAAPTPSSTTSEPSVAAIAPDGFVANAPESAACRPACRSCAHSDRPDCTCVHSTPSDISGKEEAQAFVWPGLPVLGDTGLEPVTSCVSSRRSSQLS